MKEKKIVLWGITVFFLALATGSMLVFLSLSDSAKETDTKAKELLTFSAYTDVEIFQNIPAITGKRIKVSDAADYGDENWLLNVSGTTTEDYRVYLITLEKAGFKKHSDNGEDALEGYVMTASYTKEDLTLTVSHVVQLDKTYISATYDLPLSEHLIYRDECVEGISKDARTTLHMLELNNHGNSFVIQLKNGHFVLQDGGLRADAPYLLDYLESLTQDGEKPVIEGWFLSHAHGDHTQAYNEIARNPDYNSRIYVEGVYFMEPSQETAAYLRYGTEDQIMWTTLTYHALRTQSGGQPDLYRPQLGQRYYFCDISIDVCFTPEQIPADEYYSRDFNDTSIWLMHHIDGQKFLTAGDAHLTGMRKVMLMYDKSYFNIEVFGVFHHGINVYDFFTDFCEIDTVLYTSFRMGSLWTDGTWKEAKDRNEHLQKSVKECYHRGDGTVVLTFPYTVGTAEIMPPCDWRYNTPAGVPQRPYDWWSGAR